MKCFITENIKSHFSPKKSLFDQMMTLRGEIFRQQKNRLTQRIQLGEKYYFVKQHIGVGFKEIIKNLLQLRLPIISAKNEWLALQKLQAIGIPCAPLAAYGERGFNPAQRHSFVLMQELSPVVSLETLCQDWHKNRPDFAFKQSLLAEVARLTRLLHSHGMNHRDLYICHFLLDTSVEWSKLGKIKLYLIDLHRAQIRRNSLKRWVIKDLAGLYFSSKEIGLTRRDLYRFMKIYREKPLRVILNCERDFWQQVKKRGERLYHDHGRQ